ncbi:short-chain dehydrogenase [uncultured Vibrio sp.]|uniref:short-chain dehydrogenase n=1 Tax=uncultured Vibrio sp. TaxID=114054 RepID=UPI00260480F1|nr:short-chain dehydrogenase [uncultured Vibrio sp.]
MKELDYSDFDFDFEEYSSQQFATVIFERSEDAERVSITVLKDGKINQFTGDNRYNPSSRRHASSVYVREECSDGKVIKICTIQHKGTTSVEVHSVSDEELAYLFGVEDVNGISI